MTPTPHDALFKATFSQPEHAAAALREVLPAAVRTADPAQLRDGEAP
ncbi:Rpn family recombination-promoting nuclease/putative transposase [Sorangium sp. So ce269]